MRTLLIILALILNFNFHQLAAQSDRDQPALRTAFNSAFHIGAALNYAQVNGRDSLSSPLILKHFNSISPENLLKWSNIHAHPETFNWKPADQYVALGQKMKCEIIGHTLVWHQQIPQWVFEDVKGDKKNQAGLLALMQDHIREVVGRYKGKINGWDVVNEALNEDGTFRKNAWYNIAGERYIFEAFRTAHEADPEAELYYNDYNLWKPEKREGAIKLARKLREKGLRIDGIGMQGHYQLEHPELESIEASIIAIHEAGFKVMVTELDIEVLPRPAGGEGADLDLRNSPDEIMNPYPKRFPQQMEEKLAERYGQLFGLFYKHQDKITRVTFWGVTDANSWLNNWPIRGRTNYPLPFDRDGKEKKAVMKAITKVVD